VTKPELAQWADDSGTGRAYKHPFRKIDGKALTSPSVTTVLKLVDKSGLSQWAADMTLQWAIENASLLLGKSDEDSVRWGRYRWTDVRDERAEVGTGIHNTIEAEHTGSWNFPVLDDEQRRIMGRWRELNERYLITPHRSEFTVWSLEEDYAGTADGLWDITDLQTGESWENLVVDIKTSKNTWPEHWMQLAALASADVIMEKDSTGTWTEVPMPQPGGTAIVHLREDKAEVTVETDWDIINVDYLQFRHYRTIWGLKKQAKALRDARDEANAFKGF